MPPTALNMNRQLANFGKSGKAYSLGVAHMLMGSLLLLTALIFGFGYLFLNPDDMTKPIFLFGMIVSAILSAGCFFAVRYFNKKQKTHPTV